MRVFITGGTGYVGRQILRDLAAAGHAVRALVRKGSEEDIPPNIRTDVEIIHGNIQDPSSFGAALRGCEAVVHLPGLIREFPRKGITFYGVQFEGAKNVIDAACRGGVRRFVLMSANGVRHGASTKYHRSKWLAEEYLRATELDWTIFRPSVVFGNENEGYENFISVVVRQLRMFPFIVPVPGDGRYQLQPVAIGNLSRAFVASLSHGTAAGKIYEAGGVERMSYMEILQAVASVIDVRKMYLRQPLWLLQALAHVFGRFRFFPVTIDQLRLMIEGNITTRESEFYKDFSMEPIRFSDEVTRSLGTQE